MQWSQVTKQKGLYMLCGNLIFGSDINTDTDTDLKAGSDNDYISIFLTDIGDDI